MEPTIKFAAFPTLLIAIGIPELIHIFVAHNKHEAITDVLASSSTLLIWVFFSLYDAIKTLNRTESGRFLYTLKWPFCLALIATFACLEVLIRMLVPTAVNLKPALITICIILFLSWLSGMMVSLTKLRLQDKQLHLTTIVLLLLSVAFLAAVGLTTHSPSDALKAVAALCLVMAFCCWTMRQKTDLQDLLRAALKFFPVVPLMWLLLKFFCPNLTEKTALIVIVGVLVCVAIIWTSVNNVLRNLAKNFYIRMQNKKEELKLWQDQIDKLRTLDPNRLSSDARQKFDDILTASQQAEVDWLRISKLLVELKEEGFIDDDKNI